VNKVDLPSRDLRRQLPENLWKLLTVS